MLKHVEEAIGECKKLAPTHAAARRIQGGTLHTFVARQAASFQGTILIDEISKVQLPLLAALESNALAISASCLQWAILGEAQQSTPQSFKIADFSNFGAIPLCLRYGDAGCVILCMLTST